MDMTEKVLEVMRAQDEPLNAGKIAELGSLDRKEVDKAMTKLKKEGRVKHLGISTHSNEPEVIRAAVKSGVYEVVLTAYNFRQPHVADVEKAMAEAAKAGLGIVAMKTPESAEHYAELNRFLLEHLAAPWTGESGVPGDRLQGEVPKSVAF